jgi:phosphoribosylglycinamide formyltransferase-1
MEDLEQRILNLGVLVSGRGSNLQAIIDAIEAKKLSAKISVVISNKPDALALERAQRHGIDAFAIDRKSFSSKTLFEKEVISCLERHNIDIIVLAGFMAILSPEFVGYYKNRIVNIHPSLLPAFPGLAAQRQALEYGVRYSGCTVHFVDEGMDTGPIILQAVVPLYQDDTEESLTERILKEEHIIYPKALQLIAEGRLKIEGRQVKIREVQC